MHRYSSQAHMAFISKEKLLQYLKINRNKPWTAGVGRCIDKSSLLKLKTTNLRLPKADTRHQTRATSLLQLFIKFLRPSKPLPPVGQCRPHRLRSCLSAKLSQLALRSSPGTRLAGWQQERTILRASISTVRCCLCNVGFGVPECKS